MELPLNEMISGFPNLAVAVLTIWLLVGMIKGQAETSQALLQRNEKLILALYLAISKIDDPKERALLGQQNIEY